MRPERARASRPVAHAAYGALLHIERRGLATPHGGFDVHVFRNLETHRFALALVRGDPRGREPLLCRVHSSCVTSETFGACDCDCAGQLDAALAAVAAEERGVVFYLLQEGRGAGFVAKARDRMQVQASGNRLTTFEAYEQMGLRGDHRRYEEVAWASEILGLDAPLRLLTNNPDKVAALESVKLRIESTLPLQAEPSPFNLHYLNSKSRSGHALATPSSVRRAAEPPEPVTVFDPYPLPGAARFLHAASYQLPIQLPLRAARRAGEPCWFWLHLYFDRATAEERVVITLRRDPAVRPLEFVLHDTLLDRFPAAAGVRAARRTDWGRSAAEIAAHGAGCAVFRPLRLVAPEEDSPAAAEREATQRLLAVHRPRRRRG